MHRLAPTLLVLLVLFAALPAAAQEPEDIAAELEFRHYVTVVGASVSVNDLEDLVKRTNAVERDLYFVVLRGELSGGNDLFAGKLLELELDGTVVVITSNEIGAASLVFDDETVGAAVDEAFGAFAEGDDLGALEKFAGEIPGSLPDVAEPFDEPVSNTSTTSGTSVSGGGFILIFVLVVVGGVGFMLWRNSRRDKEARAGRLVEAKAELKGQLDVIANEILELSDRVTIAEDEDATAHFRQANDTYSDVSETAESATGLAELESLSDRLDRARWRLEASEALLEGRELPTEPEDRPAHCFFDPSHRAGVEEAEIRTPAGSKTVGVCRVCAAKLERGETPKPRSINVGGRPIPAPQAPRSYGGGGLDWLSAFSILVGGRNRGASYDLGETRNVRSGRDRTRGGSVLARLGTRRSGTAPITKRRTTTRSTPSKTKPTRSRTTSPKPRSSTPKVKGRARRRR
jgi:hypothetical protein